MDVPGVWQPSSHLGTQKYQMLDLNKRLEMYLRRVNLLEEENEHLKEEAEALRRRKTCHVGQEELEAKLREIREEVEVAWKEKDRVELEVGNLGDELHTAELQRQREMAAKAEARKGLDDSRKELEKEHRAQILLREKLAQLEKELQLQVEVHSEDMAFLQTRLLQNLHVPTPVCTQVPDLRDLSQEYCHQATKAWQQAAETTQRQLQHLEHSLNQARSSIAQVTLEKKESYLKAQALAKELEGVRGKKEALEKITAQLRAKQLKELQHLQLHVESLAQEKTALNDQIAVILEDKQNLWQLKLSLSLEVATYRALLDSENPRTRMHLDNHYSSSHTFDKIRSLSQTPVTTRVSTKVEMKPTKMVSTPLQPKVISKEQTILVGGLAEEKRFDDPESNDSYAFDNTLADSRPLIRYKSDEADMNTQASHLGESDTSENDDERDPGVCVWGGDKQIGSLNENRNENNLEEEVEHLECEEELLACKAEPENEEKMGKGQVELSRGPVSKTDGNEMESEEEERYENKPPLNEEELEEDQVGQGVSSLAPWEARKSQLNLTLKIRTFPIMIRPILVSSYGPSASYRCRQSTRRKLQRLTLRMASERRSSAEVTLMMTDDDDDDDDEACGLLLIMLPSLQAKDPDDMARCVSQRQGTSLSAVTGEGGTKPERGRNLKDGVG
ncbi:nestin [Arapaima gigas]